MTDITITVPIAFRRPAHSSVKFPKLGIGAALAAAFEDIRHAFALAYVVPYRLGQRQSPVVLEGSEKGRDPSW